MKILNTITILLFVTSCGFSGDTDNIKEEIGINRFELNPTEDSDGDMISNEEESSLGRNPLVADIPELRMRFIQDYQIKGVAREKATDKRINFSINTKVGRDNPDFKYRVGKVYLKREAYKQAARIGRYSGHSYGEISEHDLTWINYPKVDSKFYLKTVMDNKKYFDESYYEVISLTVSLESSMKLKSNSHYRSINNLATNYYYYDYEKEQMEKLETKLVEKHFNEGVNQSFSVSFDIPRALIEENYFKRGEFIISEVDNYEIPELKTDYKTLLNSVRDKSIPVVFNTPLESKVSYVGIVQGGMSFSNVLGVLFENDFTISDDEIKKIGQFETNLPDFDYLAEVKDLSKKGKWFAFTSEINKSLLDYHFTEKDYISLSYILGSEISNQVEEEVFSFRGYVDTKARGQHYPLGNFSRNSEIKVFIKPDLTLYDIPVFKAFRHHQSANCGKNCIGDEYTCDFELHTFKSDYKVFEFKSSLEGEISRINLVVNEESFSLVDLIKEKKVSLKFVDKSIHILIKDIAKIKEVSNDDNNVLYLEFLPKDKTYFNGLKITSMRGKQSTRCLDYSLRMVNHYRYPLSVRSHRFAEWDKLVDWSRIIRGEDKIISKDFTMSISSIISNHYN